jgi:hypothetical protein
MNGGNMQTENDVPRLDSEDVQDTTSIKEKKPWQRPEISSFKPVSDAQGISYRVGDGINNLS